MSKTQEELFFDIKHAVLSYSQLVENYEFGCIYTTTFVMGVLQRTLTYPTEKVTASGHCWRSGISRVLEVLSLLVLHLMT